MTGAWVFTGLLRNHSHRRCCLGEGSYLGKELEPQASFGFATFTAPGGQDGGGGQEAIQRLRFSGTFEGPGRGSESTLPPEGAASLVAPFTGGWASREEEEVGGESGEAEGSSPSAHREGAAVT